MFFYSCLQSSFRSYPTLVALLSAGLIAAQPGLTQELTTEEGIEDWVAATMCAADNRAVDLRRGLSFSFTGADGNSIVAEKRSSKPIDFGFVGDVISVNSALFNLLLNQKITPVCCAITHDKNGQLLNTNADTIASEIASSMSAYYEVTLSYCFEKKGVLKKLMDEDSVIPSINSNQYEHLKKEGIINEGMLPKIKNCFEALKKGVTKVRIGNSKMITESIPYTLIKL